MYINIQTIITAASLIGALGVIGGMLISAYKFYQKPAELEKKMELKVLRCYQHTLILLITNLRNFQPENSFD